MTVGPDFEEPEVAWLESWEGNLYGQAGMLEDPDAFEMDFWWQLFEDPVLNKLLDEARRENHSLRITGLRILESRAALGIASGLRYPQVQQATGALQYVNNEASDGVDQSLGTWQAGLNLGWELDFWGRYRRGMESADAAYFASLADYRDAQVLLSAQVADLYYAYRTTALRIAIAEHNAKTQKRSFDITEKIFKSGQDSELDLQQARTQYMATLSTIPGLEIILNQTENAICALLGRAPGDLPELEGTRPLLPEIETIQMNGIPAAYLMRRPDIRAAAWRVAVQSAQIGVAKSDLYPSVTLFGNLGVSGDTEEGSAEILSLVVGPSISWNLFNYGRIKNNVRVQDARLQQAIENFQNTILQAAREIDDAAYSVLKTKEQVYPLNESVKAAERSLELGQSRYREGYADFQRVLEAQRAVAVQTEKKLINDGNHIRAIINFYKSLGGGWQEASIEEMLPEATRQTMEDRSNWGDLLTEPLPKQPIDLTTETEDSRNE